jgi:hypothetical protein
VIVEEKLQREVGDALAVERLAPRQRAMAPIGL